MPENKFLLVDLNEKPIKKLGETITNDTSRMILNYLADKKDDTEQNLAQKLGLPLSTVHYHLQKLQEAGLVKVEEFHYSSKGREVNHYQLANKYIIIAPRKVSGLRQKLKYILPLIGGAAGIAVIASIINAFNANRFGQTIAADKLAASAPLLEYSVPSSVPTSAGVMCTQVCSLPWGWLGLAFVSGAALAALSWWIVAQLRQKRSG